jgi:hypothetical protein
VSSTIDAFENGAGPQWKWLRINEVLVIDDERGIILRRRSKRAWTVAFSKELELVTDLGPVEDTISDHGRPQLSIYKHKPKDQPSGPFIVSGHEREIVGEPGKLNYAALKPAVLAAMKMLVLMDVVPRLTGEARG